VVGLASSVKAAPVGALDNKCVDYVLVLGTIEPRKNVRFVFQCLSEHRELLRRYKFVFVGRWGWGESAQKLLQTYDLLDDASSNAIVFTGFVSDAARDALMAYARVVVYPSRYEGFGLPVIEALSVGTPVITSYSSSLPEVGGDVTIYCDISSSQQLYQALEEVAIKHTMSEHVEEGKRHARITWARSFSWNETFRKIKDAALELARVNNSRLD
jgi:glycosyltransferase involved in cell wall biosynthesis